jgi:PAS domain-containing protein
MRILIETGKKPQFAKVAADDRAARGGGVSTDISSGLISRVVQGVKYMISGVTPMTWFGPQQPLLPAAQEAKGRLWDYPVGYNLQMTPRPYEGVSFSQMRGLAENYDVLRLVIETRKDQIARMQWRIKPRSERGSKSKFEGKPTPEIMKQIESIHEFFLYPDLEHTWDQWIRLILEDMLVIDAPAIHPRKTLAGQPYAFEVMDGATIVRRLNADGRTPEPPDVAYQQILKGIPAIDYSRDELVYFPRNPRSWKAFGYSPVEQIIRTVNIGLRKMIFQLGYYTEGTIPDCLIGVPETWTTSQMAELQVYWDDLLEGDLARRRHVKFIPGGLAENIHETKDRPLKDEYDEWLARVVCYAFSVSWAPFVKMINRATSDNAARMAQEEGLEPLMKWIKNLMNLLIWKYFGFMEVEFTWEEEEETKPLEQAQIDKIYVESKIKRVNEVRDRLGLEPYDDKELEAMKPVNLFGGFNPLEQKKELAEGKGKAGEVPKPGEVEKFAKGKKKISMIDRDRPTAATARGKFKKELLKLFEKGKREAAKLGEELEKIDPDIEAKVKRILAKLDLEGWAILMDVSEEVIAEVVKSGVYEALLQVGLSEENLTDTMAQKAVEYAKNRAAELVGKRRLPDGTIIDNPHAKWSIPESTRDMLRADVTKAVEEGYSTGKFSDMIEENYAFSESRAEMIARTEIAFADTRGNMIAYKESGVVAGKRWILGSEHVDMDECDENASQDVIGIDEPFQSGDMEPPQHPNCVCDFLPVFAEEMEAEA